MSKDQWDKMSQGMVAMTQKAWSDFDTEIGKLCSEPGTTCNYEALQAIHALTARIKEESK